MIEKRFYFRIELSGTGETAPEAWENALEGFTQDPGEMPPMEADLTDTPVLGTAYTIDGGEEI